MTAPGTVGVLYPNGQVCPVGDVTEALNYAETAHVPTFLVRRERNGEWFPAPSLPRPRPRATATPNYPDVIFTRSRVRRGRGRGKGRQTVAESVGGTS